jgi:ABC-type sugar transport system ATPase subunit
MNFLKAYFDGSVAGQAIVRLSQNPEVSVPFPSLEHPLQDGTPLIVGIRPEHILLDVPDGLPITIDAVENLGGMAFAYVQTRDGGTLTLQVSADTGFERGSQISIGFDPDKVFLFDPKTEVRLSPPKPHAAGPELVQPAAMEATDRANPGRRRQLQGQCPSL